MRTATEILKEGNDGHPIRTIIDNLTDDDILEVIAAAQKEAYNEAIRDAAKNAKADSRWCSDDSEEPIPFVIKKSILKLLKL